MNSGMILENTIPPFSIGNHFWYVTMSNGQNIFVNLAEACDKQTLKTSGRYFDSYLIYGQITEKLLQQMAPFYGKSLNFPESP